MKRIGLILFVVLALFVSVPSRAGASDEWCDADPVMVIQTPGGALVPVFVTTGAQGLEHTALVVLTNMTYTAKPTKDAKGTDVDVAITVPTGVALTSSHFATRSVVSTGPLGTGTIHGRTEGASGQVMHVTFRLAVA